MKARTKFLIGGALVLGSAGFLMASSIEQTGQYYLTPSELQAKLSEDASFRDAGVKMGARVVKGSIQREPSGMEVNFKVTDGNAVYAVHYKGLIPDTFTDEVDVVVEGKMGASGTFEAKVLLAKCASRYEAAPGEMPGGDKYRQTPGYKAATT